MGSPGCLRDGTPSRGRGRLDVMGFLEQVRTSCGPQSLSKSRMPGLGVCCARSEERRVGTECAV